MIDAAKKHREEIGRSKKKLSRMKLEWCARNGRPINRVSRVRIPPVGSSGRGAVKIYMGSNPIGSISPLYHENLFRGFSGILGFKSCRWLPSMWSSFEPCILGSNPASDNYQSMFHLAKIDLMCSQSVGPEFKSRRCSSRISVSFLGNRWSTRGRTLNRVSWVLIPS